MAPMAERIQLSRAKGWRMPPNTVKVDRTTKWGNPFRAGNVGPFGREPLRGKNLACWCELGKPCHADVLLVLANATPQPITRHKLGECEE